MKLFYILSLSFFILLGCSKEDESALIINSTNELYTLPVVVHIVHNGEAVGQGNNLSNERIFGQLKTVNDDFRRRIGTLGFNTHPLSDDARIEFRLAEFDPNGNCVSGINRVNYNDIPADTTGGWFFDALPNYGYWNTSQYINIWVLPFPANTVLGQSSVPYVNIPGLDTANPDGTTGVLISTPHFGTSNTPGGANLGRSLTHELGHFLGLEHLWGKVENALCTEYDDYCDDTPFVTRKTSDCDANSIENCNGTPVLTQNYMDYTKDACMNMFTKDQISRMRYVLEQNPIRASLIHSPAIIR